MLLLILANLIGIYSLISLPLASSFTIDVSNLAELGQVNLLEDLYFSQAPFRKNNDSLGVVISAVAAVVIDKKTRQVLWQKNSELARPIASITKLVSALVFLENNPGWDTEVTINASDYRDGGRRWVYQGEIVTVRDLLNIALVASDNNAVISLVRSTGLTEEEFVKAMNQKAQALGMNQSVFLEPTGLESSNLSTASDVIKLAQSAFEVEEIKKATTQSEYSFTVINNKRQDTIKNTNKLLESYLNIQAGKTGYLEEAGYCLVSEVKNSENQKVIIAVLGSGTEAGRFQDLKALSQWVFDNYEWPLD